MIVTEGKRTEPLYFNGIKRNIQNKIGGRIDIYESPTIDIYGKGSSTCKLVDITKQIVKKSHVFYQNIWIVFDKDDFEDFDQAIKDGINNGYRMAWSNQSFEYWLYLHFQYSDAALHRHVWNDKLNEIFKIYQLGDGIYKKNYEDIFDIMNQYDGVHMAINHAKSRMSTFREGVDKPSEFDPGTKVYELVEELMKFLEE